MFTYGKFHWEKVFPKHEYPDNDLEWDRKTKELVSYFTNLPVDHIFNLKQVHGKEIFQIKDKAFYPLSEQNSKTDLRMYDAITHSTPLEGDGLYAKEKHIALVIRTADCVPVFLYSEKRPLIAVLHSGWKGTVLGITSTFIAKLLSEGITEEELHVFFGPSIAKEHYMVQDDVATHFKNFSEDVLQKEIGLGYFLGVKDAIVSRLKKEYPLIKIDSHSEDVFQSKEYFSHRSKDKGRNMNVILLES